jgi:hypothetical protein
MSEAARPFTDAEVQACREQDLSFVGSKFANHHRWLATIDVMEQHLVPDVDLDHAHHMLRRVRDCLCSHMSVEERMALVRDIDRALSETGEED